MSAMSPSREGRTITPEPLIPGRTRGAELNDANRLAVEKGADILDDLRVGAAIVLLGHVADMRGQDHVRRRAQRMVDRQRLLIVDIEPGIGEATRLQRRDDRL